MSATTSIGFPAPSLLARIGAAMSKGLAKAWRVISTRQSLYDMDDRMLQDIGISRAQAQFELSRPIWKLFD